MAPARPDGARPADRMGEAGTDGLVRVIAAPLVVAALVLTLETRSLCWLFVVLA